MKDFPVFTTEYGVASLILKEIPYKQIAYIIIRDSLEPDKLLEECLSFCRICGAERVYASGHPYLEKYPLHNVIWEMRGIVDTEDIANLFPVTEQTVSKWRSIHNEKMRRVDNSATQESRDEQQIISSSGAYFIHESGQLLGIAWLNDNRLEAIASVQQRAGEKILRTVQSLIPGEQMVLDVASTNEKAVALYERTGFLKTAEKSKWYEVSRKNT